MTLGTFLPLLSTIVFLMVVNSLFRSAGPRWKTEPWRPLYVSTALLLVAGALDIWLDRTASQTAVNAANNSNSTGVAKLLQSLAQGQRNEIKLIEFAVIPLAVSLMASAFFTRADLEFSRRVAAYRSARAELSSAWQETLRLESDLAQALDARAPGREVLAKLKEVQEARRKATDGLLSAMEDFEELIGSRTVEPLDNVRPQRQRLT